MADIPAEQFHSISGIRNLTPARVSLGRAGASLPTSAQLAFTLDHARARDAVHAPFDAEGIAASVAASGCAVVTVESRAATRADYLRRPDLGRQLNEPSRLMLQNSGMRACDLVIMIGDGLSAAAVHAHAILLVRELISHLQPLRIGSVVVATHARVALGDEVGMLCHARMTLVLIGERPGLSAPDSLGAYITYDPKPGRTDADRNCVSNIHRAGLSYEEAAHKIAWLVQAGFDRSVTGVMLKDESGDATIPVAVSPRRTMLGANTAATAERGSTGEET